MKKLTILKIIITLVISGFVYLKIDIKKTIEILSHVNPLIFLVILGTMIITLFLNFINIKKLLNLQIKNKELLIKYIISWSFGLFTPGKIGDFSLSYLIKKEIPMTKSLAILSINKITTLIVLLTISIIGIFIYFSKTIAILLIIISILLFAVLLIIIKSKRIKAFILNKFKNKYTNNIVTFKETIENYLKYHKWKISINLFLTILNQIFQALGIYILLLMFKQQDISYFSVIIIESIGMITALLPFTINGIGLRETINMYLFERFSIPNEIIISIYLIIIVMNYLLAFIMMQIFINQKTIILKENPKNNEHTTN